MRKIKSCLLIAVIMTSSISLTGCAQVLGIIGQLMPAVAPILQGVSQIVAAANAGGGQGMALAEDPNAARAGQDAFLGANPNATGDAAATARARQGGQALQQFLNNRDAAPADGAEATLNGTDRLK